MTFLPFSFFSVLLSDSLAACGKTSWTGECLNLHSCKELAQDPSTSTPCQSLTKQLAKWSAVPGLLPHPLLFVVVVALACVSRKSQGKVPKMAGEEFLNVARAQRSVMHSSRGRSGEEDPTHICIPNSMESFSHSQIQKLNCLWSSFLLLFLNFWISLTHSKKCTHL